MQGKLVIVTGAFGALGRVVAAEAVGRGAWVAAVDYARAAPEGFEAELGADGLVLGGTDLTDPAGAEAAVATAATRFGRIDALINIAGGFVWETVEAGAAATWERMFALNLKTTLNASRAALPRLVESGGRIVNVGAAGALKAAAGMGAYAASKSAVHRLTEAMAEELKGKVAVNAVLPSIIDTPANRADMPGADFARWVQPKDLASVILFLASQDAAAVTGALVPVTGGV